MDPLQPQTYLSHHLADFFLIGDDYFVHPIFSIAQRRILVLAGISGFVSFFELVHIRHQSFTKKMLFYVKHRKLPNSFPYKWRTPTAYIFSAVYQLLFTIHVTGIYSSIIYLFFGFCVFLGTFNVHLEQTNLRALDAAARKQSKQPLNASSEVTQCLIQFIDIHSNARQLSEMLRTNHNFPLLCRFQKKNRRDSFSQFLLGWP